MPGGGAGVAGGPQGPPLRRGARRVHALARAPRDQVQGDGSQLDFHPRREARAERAAKVVVQAGGCRRPRAQVGEAAGDVAAPQGPAHAHRRGVEPQDGGEPPRQRQRDCLRVRRVRPQRQVRSTHAQLELVGPPPALFHRAQAGRGLVPARLGRGGGEGERRAPGGEANRLGGVVLAVLGARSPELFARQVAAAGRGCFGGSQHRRLRPRRFAPQAPGEQGPALVPRGQAQAHPVPQPRRRRKRVRRRRGHRRALVPRGSTPRRHVPLCSRFRQRGFLHPHGAREEPARAAPRGGSRDGHPGQVFRRVGADGPRQVHRVGRVAVARFDVSPLGASAHEAALQHRG